MTDNELIAKLQDDVIAAVNASAMPLAVKGIVLENTLLRIKVQLREEEAAQAQATAPAAEQADAMEATEAPVEPVKHHEQAEEQRMEG